MTPDGRWLSGHSDVGAAARTSSRLNHRGESLNPVVQQLQIGVVTRRGGLHYNIKTHIWEASFSESLGDLRSVVRIRELKVQLDLVVRRHVEDDIWASVRE